MRRSLNLFRRGVVCASFLHMPPPLTLDPRKTQSLHLSHSYPSQPMPILFVFHIGFHLRCPRHSLVSFPPVFLLYWIAPPPSLTRTRGFPFGSDTPALRYPSHTI